MRDYPGPFGPWRIPPKHKRVKEDFIRWYVILPLFVLVFSLSSCVCVKPVSSTGSADDLSVVIWASSDCVQIGAKIKLRATVTNNGTQTERVQLIGQPVLDIIVGNEGPAVRWSDGKPLTADLTHLELKPGQSKSIDIDWTVKSPTSGSVFSVNASFVYDPRPPGGPINPGVIISVSICSRPFGP